MFTVEPQFLDPKSTLSPDWRLWGDGCWCQNTRHMCHPMLASGDTDLMVIDPTQAVETFRTGVLDDMPSVAGLRSITARLCELPEGLTTRDERSFFVRMREACPLVPTEGKTVHGVKQLSLAPARTYKLED